MEDYKILRYAVVALFALCGFIGCAEDIAPTDNVNNTVIDTTPNTIIVDATSKEDWIYFDLDQSLSTPTTEMAMPGWDIAFQRYKVKSNNGVSGDEGVEVAIVEDMMYEEVEATPDDVMFLIDQEDSDDYGSDPDYVFNMGDQWYDYDLTTHTLSARDTVYIVHSTEDQYFKILFLDYYNEVGDSAFLKIKLQQIEPPN